MPLPVEVVPLPVELAPVPVPGGMVPVPVPVEMVPVPVEMVPVPVPVPVEVVLLPVPQDGIEVIELRAAVGATIEEEGLRESHHAAFNNVPDPELIDTDVPTTVRSIEIVSSCPSSSTTYSISTSTSDSTSDSISCDLSVHDSISAIAITPCPGKREEHSTDKTTERKSQKNVEDNKNQLIFDDCNCMEETPQKISTAEEEDEIEELRIEFELAMLEEREFTNALKEKSVKEVLKLSLMDEKEKEIKEQIVGDIMQKEEGGERRRIWIDENIRVSQYIFDNESASTVSFKDNTQDNPERLLDTIIKQNINTDMSESIVKAKIDRIIHETNKCPEIGTWHNSVLDDNQIENEMNIMDTDGHEKSMSMLISQYVENLQNYKENFMSHREQFINIIQVKFTFFIFIEKILVDTK